VVVVKKNILCIACEVRKITCVSGVRLPGVVAIRKYGKAVVEPSPPPPQPSPQHFRNVPTLKPIKSEYIYRLLDFFKFFFVCRNRAFSYYKRWDGVGRPITIYLYNILSLSGGRRPFHPSILSSVPSSIHPSSSSRKKKMMDDETVYLNVYVIQSCSLWKTPLEHNNM
jgi:hypothetical protein